MKPLVYTISMLISLSSLAQTEYIDPTGTYKMVNKTKKKYGDIFGYEGNIQVKKIDVETIVMSFEVNKGAPSYNSGSFVDTLAYIDNRSIYTNPEYDTTCKITFDFSKRGITVKEETVDYNFGCGFGHAVIADGFYKRTSKKTPVIIDLMTGKPID